MEIKESEIESNLTNNNDSNKDNTYIKLNEENNTKNKEKTNIKKHGNLYLFCYNSKQIPKIVIGPDWIYFIIGFLFLLIYSFVIIFIILYYSNIYSKIFGLILTILQILFYILSFLINPGVQLQKANKNDLKTPTCIYCGVIKFIGNGQIHCDQCNACIIGYDHHCPWTGKCIGDGNKNYFRLFIFFTFFNFSFMVVIIALFLERI